MIYLLIRVHHRFYLSTSTAVMISICHNKISHLKKHQCSWNLSMSFTEVQIESKCYIAIAISNDSSQFIRKNRNDLFMSTLTLSPSSASSIICLSLFSCLWGLYGLVLLLTPQWANSWNQSERGTERWRWKDESEIAQEKFENYKHTGWKEGRATSLKMWKVEATEQALGEGFSYNTWGCSSVKNSITPQTSQYCSGQ